MSLPHGSRHNRGLLGVAAVLGIAGLTLGAAGLRAQQAEPPRPAAAEAGLYASAEASTTSPADRMAQGPVLGSSTPAHLAIPAIGVETDLLSLGLNPDRSVQVPPHASDSKAGWYRYSPTPGQLGPSVLLGHVHSARYGPGVFFRLGALKRGDGISVTRVDRTVAVFRVDAVATYPKDGFPTRTVYGDTDHAALRLVTCGGELDEAGYVDNVVAFASLESVHPA